MPTNLYGPNDNFSPDGSHVLPALIRRYDDAVRFGSRSVTSGAQVRLGASFFMRTIWRTRAFTLLEHYDGAQLASTSEVD